MEGDLSQAVFGGALTSVSLGFQVPVSQHGWTGWNAARCYDTPKVSLWKETGWASWMQPFQHLPLSLLATSDMLTELSQEVWATPNLCNPVWFLCWEHCLPHDTIYGCCIIAGSLWKRTISEQLDAERGEALPLGMLCCELVSLADWEMPVFQPEKLHWDWTGSWCLHPQQVCSKYLFISLWFLWAVVFLCSNRPFVGQGQGSRQ